MLYGFGLRTVEINHTLGDFWADAAQVVVPGAGDDAQMSSHGCSPGLTRVAFRPCRSCG